MVFKIISELNFFQFPQLPTQYFYIGENYNTTLEVWNRDIAYKINMPAADLKKYLFYNFNGWSPDGPFGYYPRVYFKTRSDAEKALEWIESMQVLAQMYK